MKLADLSELNPPAPYQLVLYDKIAEGDIFRSVDEPEWRPVDEFQVGDWIKNASFAVARIEPPDLFRFARPDEPIDSRDMIWVDEEFGWVPLNDLRSAFGGSRMRTLKVSEIIDWFEQHDKVVHYVKVDETCDDPRVVKSPVGHLELRPGDTMSYGDLVVYEGIKEWIPISEYLSGSPVQESGWNNGYSRVCRPVSQELTEKNRNREKRMTAELFKSKD